MFPNPLPPVYGSSFPPNGPPPNAPPSQSGIMNLVNVFNEYLFTPEDRLSLPPPYYQPYYPSTVDGLEYYDEDGSVELSKVDGAGKPKKRIRPSINSLNENEKTERREKNREHARQSRVRKKFLMDSLQQSVKQLEKENEKLRSAIREYLPEEAETIFIQCVRASSALPVAQALPPPPTRTLDNPDFSLVQALQTTEQTFLITDPSLPDNPIVYASQSFMTLTGYALNEILGRNCRFLQGPKTDPHSVKRIRHAIERGEDITEVLLNYRADGTTFWNQLFCAGLRDTEGNIVNFLGVQCQVTEAYAQAYLQNHQGKETTTNIAEK